MVSLRRLHREDGETGHFGEFFLGLGAFVIIGGLVLIVWGIQAPPADSTSAVASDAVSVGALFIVGGIGIATFGGYGVYSGWGRHHARFDAGGDKDVSNAYDPVGH